MREERPVQVKVYMTDEVRSQTAPQPAVIFDVPQHTHKYCLTCGYSAPLDATLCAAKRLCMGRITDEACGGNLALPSQIVPFSWGSPAFTQPFINSTACPYCGGSYSHPNSICPMIASVEYHDNGVLKKVTLKK